MKKLVFLLLVLSSLSVASAAELSNPYPENNSYVPGGIINFSVLVYDVNVSTMQLHIIAKDAYEKGEPWQDFGLSCYSVNSTHYKCYREVLFSIVGSDTVEYFYFDGYDNANNYVSLGNQTHPLVFVLDRNPPVIEFLTPKNNSYVGSKFYLNVSVSDASSGLDSESVYYSYDGSAWIKMNSNGDVFYDYLDFSAFNNNRSVSITVRARDLVSNEGNNTITVTVDKEKPTIALVKPNVTTLVGLVEFEIEVYDSISGVDLGSAVMKVSTLSQNMICVAENTVRCSTLLDTTILSDGNYTFYFSVKDVAGNAAELAKIFEIRNSQPLLQIANEKFYISGDVDIKALLNDPSGTLSEPQIRINNLTYDSGWLNMNLGQDGYWYYTWRVQNFADGKYNVTVRSVNLQGKVFEDTREFILDRIEPRITIIIDRYVAGEKTVSVIVDDEVAMSTDVTLVFESWEASPLCSLQLNGKRAVCNYNLDSSNLSNGNQSVLVRAYDKAGNLAQKEEYFIVDKELPRLDYLMIYPSYSEYATTTKFYVYASDEVSGIASVIVRLSLLGLIEQRIAENMGNYWLATADISDIGSYKVSVIITDVAGNSVNYENVGQLYIGPINCGDGICSENENYCNCRLDCSYSCDVGSVDCGYGRPLCLNAVCGDGICMESELGSCQSDCFFFITETGVGRGGVGGEESFAINVDVVKILQDNIAIVAGMAFALIAIAALAIKLGSAKGFESFDEFYSEISNMVKNLSHGAKFRDDVRALIITLDNFKRRSIKEFYKEGMTVREAYKLEEYLKNTEFNALEERRIRIVETIQQRLKDLLLEKNESVIERELLIIKDEWEHLNEIIKAQKNIIRRFKKWR